MKKKVFAISMAGLTAASALLSGCGASGNTGASGTDSAASGSADGGELYVYNWGEYIDEDVISQFEEETGITVVYDLFETNRGNVSGHRGRCCQLRCRIDRLII